jgi:acetyl esterase/lipase
LDINRLDPQLAPVFRQAPALPYHMPELLPAGRALYEFFTYSQPEDGVDVRSIEVGDTVVNTFAPHKGRHGGAFFWIHGGGLVSGQANQLSRGASAVAKMTGTTGITVNYRLAPEHPFPAAHDDCFAAWTWIQENAAELGIDPARVAILGSSAGGGLAASLVQRIHDEGGQQPACQVLFYPMLDDRTAADTDQDSGGHYVWSNASNRVAWNAFLSPQKAGDADLPNYAVAGRREDLSGLPPTWLGVGDVDLFYAEAKTYAERLEAAGVPVETHYAKGAPHVFEVMAPTADVSQAFLGSAFGYLGKSLAHKG